MTEPEMTTPTLDDVIDPQLDKGLPHDRELHGGMPRENDDALAHLADQDREAVGADQINEDGVPPSDES